MEVKCYIPKEFHNLIDKNTGCVKKFSHTEDIDFLVKEIMAVYYHYCVVCEEPMDLTGLELLNRICQKLIIYPKYSYHIRGVLENLDIAKNLIKSNNISLFNTIKLVFTKDELVQYINN